MVKKLCRQPFVLAVGAALSMYALGGPVSAEEIPELVMVPQTNDQVVLVEEPDGTAGIAAPGRPIEVIQERYPGGELKVRREVTQDAQDNFILHGEWKMWDEAGNLIGAGEYRNNHREGQWFRIHSAKDAPLFSTMPYSEFSAPFRSEATFKDGKLDGKWAITDSEGRVVSEAEYANGVLNGASKWHYVSGSLMKEASYENGLLNGLVRTYDANSTLIEEEKFEEGHKIAMKIERNKAGQKEWEAMYMHAQLVIDTEVDWWNAKPATYKAVGEDVKHGLATGWHPNGQMRVQGVYDRDRPDGQFTWWYSNGQEEVSGGFKEGLKHGMWVWRHPNGLKAMMGESQEGSATGLWYKWQADGSLLEKTDFTAMPQQVPTLATEEKPQEDPIESPVETSQAPLDELFTR